VVPSIQDILSPCLFPEIVSFTVNKTVILCGGPHAATASSVTSSEEQTRHV
jgi:hypothetical protein